jgi:hypothetical protein
MLKKQRDFWLYYFENRGLRFKSQVVDFCEDMNSFFNFFNKNSDDDQYAINELKQIGMEMVESDNPVCYRCQNKENAHISCKPGSCSRPCQEWRLEC